MNSDKTRLLPHERVHRPSGDDRILGGERNLSRHLHRRPWRCQLKDDAAGCKIVYVEGRNILCDYGAPLALKYVSDVIDTSQFDPWFVGYFAAELAYGCCERLTGSDAKQEAALKRRDHALTQAANSDALENTPEAWADDTWILARLQ